MESKKIGIVFPGYGEQLIGMGKDLYDQERIVQEFFEQAAGVSGINFVKLLFASSDQEISEIIQGYLSVYLFETSLYQVLYQRGLRPDFVAGYGIGEYAAAFASGSLSFVDGLYILNKYAQFYTDFLKDKEYTVLRIVREFDLSELEKLCESLSTQHMVAYVAAQNTEHAFYVAGHQKIIEKVQKHCIKEVIRKVRDIGAAYEMHSQLVDPVVEHLKLYYHKIQFKELTVPVITNVDGVYVTSSAALESAIIRKINNRNQWYAVMQGFIGCDIIVSVGPGEQLIEWFKEIYPDKEYYSIASLKDISSIEHIFEKVNLADSPNNQTFSSDATSELVDQLNQPTNLVDADSVNERSEDYDDESDQD